MRFDGMLIMFIAFVFHSYYYVLTVLEDLNLCPSGYLAHNGLEGVVNLICYMLLGLFSKFSCCCVLVDDIVTTLGLKSCPAF